METELLTLGIVVLSTLMISAMCSLLEAILLSLTPSQIASLSERRPRIGAAWQRFKENIQQPIGVILLINTTAHTMGAAIAGAEFDALYGNEWVGAFSLAFTFVMLQFTEILPKTLGVRYNQRLAPAVAPPLAALVTALGPLLRVVHWINRPFEGRGRGDPSASTVEEIASLAGLARMSKQIGRHEERIIRSASRLRDVPARDVMIPVDQVAFLSAEQSLQEAFLAAHLEAHTRFPICERGDPHAVLGFVNFKELVYSLHVNPSAPELRGIIRPVQFVSPDDSASELIRMFVDAHVHMAIVREGGHTLGLVTLEDLVEELLGELEDEFDRLPRVVHQLAGDVWMVGGGTPIGEVLAQLGLSREGSSGNLSSWLLARLGPRPTPGSVHREGGLEFSVRRMRRGRIFEASIRRTAQPPAGSEGRR